MTYRLNNFEVRKCTSGYEIIKHDSNACMITNVINVNEMWFDVKPFNSFIHAVRYLKTNVDDLI